MPHDVRFAQKASALVKAAGLDPRLLDLEKFRQMAHIIFCRVYHVIYKEKPEGFVEEPQNQDDFVWNAQSIVSAMRNRLGDDSVLPDVNGQDICFGNHRGIALLVDALFTEGQRMWLLKQHSNMREAVNNDDDGAAAGGYYNSSNNNNNSGRNHVDNTSSQQHQLLSPRHPYLTSPRAQSAGRSRDIKNKVKSKTYSMRNYFDEILVPASQNSD